MRLKSFRVTNFRSVLDSGWVEVGERTCLVGKNEAGKTAILHALGGLNPHPSTPIAFDKERDYPRRFYTEYAKRHGGDEAEVVRARWVLDGQDVAAVVEWFGSEALRKVDEPDGTIFETYRRYGDDGQQLVLDLDVPSAMRHLMSVHALNEEDRSPLAQARVTEELVAALEAVAEPSATQTVLLAYVKKLPRGSVTGTVKSVLQARIPKFMYFSHYDRMAGEVRLDDIQVVDGALLRPRHVPAYATSMGTTSRHSRSMSALEWATVFSSTSWSSPVPRWRRSRRQAPTSP